MDHRGAPEERNDGCWTLPAFHQREPLASDRIRSGSQSSIVGIARSHPVILGVHQGIRGRRRRRTRCGGRLGVWTRFLAFLGCHGGISLWAHEVACDRSCLYDTPWHPPCHCVWGAFACTSCLGVSCPCPTVSSVIDCA